MSIPAVDLSYFADPEDPFYAPTVNAARLMRDFRDGMRFWTPTIPGTRFLAAHSYVVTDAERITPSLGLMFDLPEAEAAELAQLVAEYALTSPGLQYGNHPLLSFTAFATSSVIYPDRPTTTRPRAKVLTYAQFLAAFDAAYPTLIAPDAPQIEAAA